MFWLLALTALVAPFAVHSRRCPIRDCGALCDYVRYDDGLFSWEVVDTIRGVQHDSYTLNVTSQRWFNESFSDRPVWFHHLSVHVPHNLRIKNRAFLYISEGSNTDSLPTDTTTHNPETIQYAINTGMVTAMLRQIPNQPFKFVGAEDEMKEGDLVAWTWREFLQSEKEDEIPEILLRFPMVKGASRAMDAIQQFVSSLSGNFIEKFMVAGESKRGWTTWLVGAVDKRVEAISPIVLSLLNMSENLRHYYQSFGGWPFAFYGYWVLDILAYVDGPRFKDMESYIDPIRYRNLLRLPKLMINGASDEFLLCDDYAYFFDDLKGPKYIWLLENTGHNIGRSPLKEEVWKMLETFYLALIEGVKYPKIKWTKKYTKDGGSITLRTKYPIRNITAWAADTPEIVSPRRDFRLAVLDGNDVVSSGVVWLEYPVQSLVTLPWKGSERSFTFSSEALILPEGFPFEDCSEESCRAPLV